MAASRRQSKRSAWGQRIICRNRRMRTRSSAPSTAIAQDLCPYRPSNPQPLHWPERNGSISSGSWRIAKETSPRPRGASEFTDARCNENSRSILPEADQANLNEDSPAPGDALGSTSVATVPRGECGASSSRPPSCSSNERVRKRPSPMPSPGCLVVKNGSPACASTSGDIPNPWSEISIRKVSLSGRSRRTIGEPSLEACRALRTTALSAWLNARGGTVSVAFLHEGSRSTLIRWRSSSPPSALSTSSTTAEGSDGSPRLCPASAANCVRDTLAALQLSLELFGRDRDRGQGRCQFMGGTRRERRQRSQLSTSLRRLPS